MKSFAALIALCLVCHAHAASSWKIGAGIGDVTGPAAEVNLMGYAKPGQTAGGVLDRLWARAYIFEDSSKAVCFVTVDMGMGAQLVTDRVIAKLATIPAVSHFNHTNTMISGTHSHSTPAGFLQFVLYEVTSLGYVKESTDAFVDGIVDAIVMAQSRLQLATTKWAWGTVEDANINRSPSAYTANPADERALFQHNTDHNMTLLRMDAADGTPLAMVNWFAVHGTSINNTNTLLSSDNRGYASHNFELAMNGPSVMPGNGSFVGAFASSNLGDVSPNVNGTYCMNSGKPCNYDHSTCDGKNEYCVGRGPGATMYESAAIVGQRQLDVAQKLFNSASTLLDGPINYVHTFVDMRNASVMLPNGTEAHTCKPAMGYAFAAGTTDGPGAFNFEQGTTTSNPFWNAVRDLIATPTAAEIACQAPKPILLPTGETHFPYDWDANIVPLQVFRLGQFFIIGVPAELTTMAGRRLRSRFLAAVVAAGAPADSVVVIAGLSNTYSSYCTTFEEYQVQRYEGASTIYGPHTLEAYIQRFERMAGALVSGGEYPAGPTAPAAGKLLSLLPGVIVDGHPIGSHFGAVSKQPAASYKAGATVEVKFVSANPRSNHRGNPFLLVQQLVNSEWVTVRTDAHWDTRYYWTRPNALSDQSTARITWEIPASTTPGQYRIVHNGYYKPLSGDAKSFSGTSNTFTVSA